VRGDLNDIVSRFRTVLPKRWFAEKSPNLNAVLQSIAAPWVWLYDTISYVISQARLSTATDYWLDLISYDYFGDLLSRNSGESDACFRTRVKAALQRQAATRSAVSAGLQALTGARSIIFEPAACVDTGCYGTLAKDPNIVQTGLAYGEVGGWGSLNMPLQFFVTAVRPPNPAINMLAGYGTPNAGYGEGTISYVDLSVLPGHVTDEDIKATLSSLLPVNAVAWLRIQ
jgi:hypothetical protein